jgi:hypothetical protein
MKNIVFLNIRPCGSYERRVAFHHLSDKNRLARKNFSSLRRLLVTANFGPSSPTHMALKMEVTISSETWALTRSTQRNIPEDSILHSYCRENLKSYIALSA